MCGDEKITDYESKIIPRRGDNFIYSDLKENNEYITTSYKVTDIDHVIYEGYRKYVMIWTVKEGNTDD